MQLSTLGSSNVTVDVEPSALDEAGPGGVQVRFTHTPTEDATTYQFTRQEAMWLWEELRALLMAST